VQDRKVETERFQEKNKEKQEGKHKKDNTGRTNQTI
jgi:hypothetical protein